MIVTRLVAPFRRRRATGPADVALLLEGTYPFVRGGVSSWVDELLRGLPELRFSLVFLGGAAASYGEARYPLPSNVVGLERHFLMDPPPAAAPRPRRGSARDLADVIRLHEALGDRATRDDDAWRVPFARLARRLGRDDLRLDFLHGERTFEHLRAEYRRSASTLSFVDWFWTVRTMHTPLFALGRLAARLPPARLYHSVSTGYAGFLGALLKARTGRPFVLTEHGIYTKERIIDLASADWITGDEGGAALRDLWIRFFQGLGRLAYASADPIISLYEGNRRRQIEDGAAHARTRVIPNGIEVARFSRLRSRRGHTPPPVLGLLGRVVPIKDIRTFIRAMRTVCTRLPAAEGWIIGPESEDEAYARECRDLARSLGLESRVRFLGFRRPDEILPDLGLLCLTSISEALPLVLLEGFAAGVPAVATDVGSCRELIEGRAGEDRAIGPAGAVVPLADPEATAAAAISLLTDGDRWRAAQQSGIERVERFYTQAGVLARYREVYATALSSVAA